MKAPEIFRGSGRQGWGGVGWGGVGWGGLGVRFCPGAAAGRGVGGVARKGGQGQQRISVRH